MPPASYRAAIVGLGFIGGADQVSGDALGQRVADLDGTHLDALSRHPRLDLVAGSSRDPGGWGLLRLEGGLMVTVDAADAATVPARIEVNATRGRAVTGADDVTLEYGDGRRDHWPGLRHEATSMDRAVAEIVAWLDGGTTFPYPTEEAVHTLEAIVAFYASDARRAAWVDLPLTGADRDRELRSG
jgi:hypothetical protein